MDPAVGAAAWAVLGGAAAVLLVLLAATLTLLVVRRSEGRRSRREDAARADVEALHARVEELTEELRRTRATVLPSSEFVITTAGDPTGDPAGDPADRPQVPETAVLSATLGEPLVRAAAWTYGVRGALSPQNRNRIAFEMRREVKRARKERRRAARRAAVRRGRHVGPDAGESAA
jgi:hypothetical protein